MEQPNLKYIYKLSGGDTTFEAQLIAVLKKEFPLEKEQFQNSIDANALSEVAEIVHKLKHKFSILGLEKGYQLAVEYENNLINNNKSLTLEFSKVLNNISNYLNELKSND